MTRAVWSFWGKPFRAHHRRAWLSDRHHLMSWVLSVHCGARHYEHTTLVTDTEGARLLVDTLGLRFSHVDTGLDALQGADPQWWVLGKLWAYRAQREPFVHLDSDVYLWKRLPGALEQAPVCGQNPETFPLTADSWYRPAAMHRALQNAQGWMPEEWQWSVAQKLSGAVCCGILGGSDTAFIAHYADQAIRMIEHPSNQAAWAELGNVIGDNILLEQYFLAACLGYHRGRRGSRFRSVAARYLFESTDQAFDEQQAERAGYTHLIGGAKRDPDLMLRLDARVTRECPEFHARCHAAAG